MRMANDIVPKCFHTTRYLCQDDDDEKEYTFYSKLEYVQRVEIKWINGSEAHLKKMSKVFENIKSDKKDKVVKYLYLDFRIRDNDVAGADSDEVAK
jgi:hypothetical protein